MAFGVLCLTFLAYFAHRADAHGYLTQPTARRLEEKRSEYTSITAFGAGQHITNCGRDGLSMHSSQDVVTDVQRGTTMKFDVTIDAHHAGHLEMRLCPFIIDGDNQDLSSCTLLQRASAAEAGIRDCATNDDRDICAVVDPNNPGWWYLAPKGTQGKVHSMWFHIPSNLNCPNDRCTVQFTWKTANSCNPHPASYCNYYHDVVGPQNTWCKNWYCGGFCDMSSSSVDNCEATMGNRKCCSEVFTNCAEIKLTGEGGPAPSGSPAMSSPTLQPTLAPSAITGSSPGQTPTNSPTPVAPTPPAGNPVQGNSCTGEACRDVSHCRSKWGYCGTGSSYCNAESTWTLSGCAGASPSTARPTPLPTAVPTEPESHPEVEPESEPEPELESVSCVPVGNCGQEGWCDQEAYNSWCRSFKQGGACPSPFCTSNTPAAMVQLPSERRLRLAKPHKKQIEDTLLFQRGLAAARGDHESEL